MTEQEYINAARQRVTDDHPGDPQFNITKDRLYSNVMGGTLVTVSFDTNSKRDDSNHVHFGADDNVRVYRWYSDILNAVQYYKERRWFFRFLETVGIGGLIAFMLMLIFSVLLCVLAFKPPKDNTTVEVIKLAFTLILGYFFGQNTTKK